MIVGGTVMRRDVSASALGMLLGFWFFASSFMWPHTTASRVNSIVLGVVTAAVGLAASRAPGARWLYLLPAAWMVASIWIIPHEDRFTIWNNASIAIALVLIPMTSVLFTTAPARRPA